jgi:hypothetical protein
VQTQKKNFIPAAPKEYTEGQGRFDDQMQQVRKGTNNLNESIRQTGALNAQTTAENSEFIKAQKAYATNMIAPFEKSFFEEMFKKIKKDPKAKIKFLNGITKDPENFDYMNMAYDGDKTFAQESL